MNNPFLPDLAFNYEPTDDDRRVDAVVEATTTIDRNVRLCIKLYEARSENFARIAYQASEQIKTARKHAYKIEDEGWRKEMIRSLNRARSVLDFLQEYGPYVEGSGVLRSSRPREKIETITSGGLPGHGKRQR